MNVNLFLLNLRRQPDAALIDLQRMRAASVHSRIVAMSTELSVPLLAESLKAGADGFLLKDVSADALSLFLKLVIIGEKVFPTSLADYITNIDVADQHASIGMGEHNLSKREVQILKRLVRGESNKVIARSLDITEGTVKVHIKNLFRKIQAHNRTQAALWAREQGIFSLGADGT